MTMHAIFFLSEGLLAGFGGIAATLWADEGTAAAPCRSANQIPKGTPKRPAATMKNGASIHFKDCGAGPVITFFHGWPLPADAWDAQMLFFGEHGYRVVAHDRRGHGRSDQIWAGNGMGHLRRRYHDQIAAAQCATRNQGRPFERRRRGEIAQYIGRHGTERVTAAR